MRRRQRQQLFIGGIVTALSLMGLGLGVFLYTEHQKQIAQKNIAANTVQFASEGYNIAVNFLLPKADYDYEITGEDRPRFPVMTIKDISGTYTITATITQATKATQTNNLEAAKQRDNFTEFKENNKTGELSGYAYDDSYQFNVQLNLAERDGNFYNLNLKIENISNAASSKGLFDSTSVQTLIKSARLDANYSAPDRGYVTDDRHIMKVDKFANEIDGFTIDQRSSVDNKLYFTGTKYKSNISLKVHPVSTSKTVDEAIKDDYYVKEGSHVYDQTTKYGGVTLKHTAPESDVTGHAVFFYYIKKDGVVMQGAARYNTEGKNAFDKMSESVFKNLTIDKARAKKYIR